MFGFKLVRTRDIANHNQQFMELTNLLRTATEVLKTDSRDSVETLDLLKAVAMTESPVVKQTLIARLKDEPVKRVIGFGG